MGWWKKTKGLKRYVIVDTLGNILGLEVHAANIHDTKKGYKLFEDTLERYPNLLGISADEGYRGTTADYIEKILHKEINISKKERPFKVIPKRWIVEGTFSWFNPFRRLSKDYEKTTASSKNIIWAC